MNSRMRTASFSLFVLALGACGDRPQPTPTPEPPQPDTAAAPAPAPDAATEAAPAPAPASIPTGRSPAPPGAKVRFIAPAHDSVVKSPVTVEFAVEGITLAPAGTNEPNTGHHHVLIDTGLPALDRPIPQDYRHVHFGQGQTKGQIELDPGQHSLQLLLGDGNHVPHDPPIASEQILVTVEEPATP